MKAIVRDRFGTPEVLQLREVEQPAADEDGVLVRVRAASLNRADWYAVTGTPYVGRAEMGLRRPKQRGIGHDFAGTVEAVGGSVEHLQAGDEVFGSRVGALGEYVAAGKAVARMPRSLGFEEAACLPIAGVTALQALRDKGGVQPGQRVLVNGASGGVGTLTIQVAKSLGADVTAVCSTRNVELARELGADRVVDYTREDFTRGGARYDLIVDVAGSRRWSHLRRVLTPTGKVVVVGGAAGRFLGPLVHVGATLAAARRCPQQATFFVAQLGREDLGTLAELADKGELKPVVERTYPLRETAEALRYVGAGHPRAKVVVTVPE